MKFRHILRSKRAWLMILSAPFLAGIVVWAVSYHTSEFKGGVRIRDSGFFSYPRYHAELGSLPLWQPGESQFTVRGLPPDSLDLVLPVSEATNADRRDLTSLATSLMVTMTDSSGKVMCTASGHLSDARTRGLSSWVLSSDVSDASFWHPRCRELAINRSKAYTVKVTVSEVDPRSPHRTLTVILQGGGNELP